MIERQWPGLPASPTYLPSSDTECISLDILLSGGYGMAAFRLVASDAQTTADLLKMDMSYINLCSM